MERTNKVSNSTPQAHTTWKKAIYEGMNVRYVVTP